MTYKKYKILAMPKRLDTIVVFDLDDTLIHVYDVSPDNSPTKHETFKTWSFMEGSEGVLVDLDVSRREFESGHMNYKRRSKKEGKNFRKDDIQAELFKHRDYVERGVVSSKKEQREKASQKVRVFYRPHMRKVLKVLSRYMKLATWSSGDPDFVYGVMKTKEFEGLPFEFIWDVGQCSRKTGLSYGNFDEVVRKDVDKVVKKYKCRTILVDNNPEKGKYKKDGGEIVGVEPWYGFKSAKDDVGLIEIMLFVLCKQNIIDLNKVLEQGVSENIDGVEEFKGLIDRNPKLKDLVSKIAEKSEEETIEVIKSLKYEFG